MQRVCSINQIHTEAVESSFHFSFVTEGWGARLITNSSADRKVSSNRRSLVLEMHNVQNLITAPGQCGNKLRLAGTKSATEEDGSIQGGKQISSWGKQGDYAEICSTVDSAYRQNNLSHDHSTLFKSQMISEERFIVQIMHLQKTSLGLYVFPGHDVRQALLNESARFLSGGKKKHIWEDRI